MQYPKTQDAWNTLDPRYLYGLSRLRLWINGFDYVNPTLQKLSIQKLRKQLRQISMADNTIYANAPILERLLHPYKLDDLGGYIGRGRKPSNEKNEEDNNFFNCISRVVYDGDIEDIELRRLLASIYFRKAQVRKNHAYFDKYVEETFAQVIEDGEALWFIPKGQSLTTKKKKKGTSPDISKGVNFKLSMESLASDCLSETHTTTQQDIFHLEQALGFNLVTIEAHRHELVPDYYRIWFLKLMSNEPMGDTFLSFQDWITKRTPVYFVGRVNQKYFVKIKKFELKYDTEWLLKETPVIQFPVVYDAKVHNNIRYHMEHITKEIEKGTADESMAYRDYLLKRFYFDPKEEECRQSLRREFEKKKKEAEHLNVNARIKM